MTTPERQSALQVIFSFFLGLMVVAFIGVGVNTFYESPQQKYSDELQKLYNDQNLNPKQDPAQMTAEERAKWEATQKRINDLQTKQQDEMEGWLVNTSIVLVAFATVVMAVSLIRSEQLRTISNGLLLGGLFTMIYGTGMSAFSGNSKARFATIAVALVVTLGLGYLKFVRGRDLTPAPAAPAAEPQAAPPATPDAPAGPTGEPPRAG